MRFFSCFSQLSCQSGQLRQAVRPLVRLKGSSGLKSFNSSIPKSFERFEPIEHFDLLIGEALNFLKKAQNSSEYQE